MFKGMYAALSTTYLAEIAPLKYRGIVECMHEFGYSSGALVASVLGNSDILGMYSQ